MANEKRLDLIDRKALGIGYCNPLVFDKSEYAHGWNCAIDILMKAPTVDAMEVVHGHWFCLEPEIGLFECSECEHKILRASCNYCPNCGAKMDGDGNG